MLCEEEKTPSGSTIDGKFNCMTCGKEWILEKRKQKRYHSLLHNPEQANLLAEFITIFDTNLKIDEMSNRLLAIFQNRLGIERSALLLTDELNQSFDYISFQDPNNTEIEKKLKKLHPKFEDNNLHLNECLLAKKIFHYDLDALANKFIKLYQSITATRYQILIPILYGDKNLGIITLDFSDREEMLFIYQNARPLQLIAEQFAIALFNAIAHKETTQKYINFMNLNSSCLLLNKLYLNNSTEIIKMTLLSISGFIDTDQNTLLISDNKSQNIQVHKLIRTIESIDLTLESMDSSLYDSFQIFFNRKQLAVLATREYPVIEKLGYRGKEILILPGFVVQGKEYIFVLGRNTRRKFTDDEIELLSAYCSQVKITIENSFMTRQIASQERLNKEVQIAQDIQMNLLPREMPVHPRYEFSGFMKPAREIGGDYYDIFESPDKTDMVISIGDVSGKGVPAGMVMVTARTIIHSISRKNTTSWDILKGVNTYLFHNYKNSVVLRFMSLIIFRWKSNSDEFHFSGAGHGNIYIFRQKTNSIESILTGGIVLGIQPEIDDFENYGSIHLEIGDMILMVTDGVTEAMNRRSIPFGEEQLIHYFAKYKDLDSQNLLNSLYVEVRKHVDDAEPHDDITMLCIHRKF